ncbi:MAG: DUF2974 domain-containing protein [Lachnospiraceae bacterium]|nr:DUF2974 domain-containing protein [Lachnospiraceae bacterium]
MGKQLTTEQVLLLNNLMYMTEDDPLKNITSYQDGNLTVSKIVNNIDVNQLQANKDYGSFMTGSDWKKLIQAVKNDDQLMNVQIKSTNVDNTEGGGGGASALFVDPSTKDAVVVFRGTASKEWKDNFVGGGSTGTADGVSTTHQQNALKWYQSLGLDDYNSVTVSGHSKGGNKAKYITVMDDSVDRCLSFDGQGFSDEFVEKYKDAIARNQDKILNNNVDSDYVNLLLNDIGNTIFYKGYDYGDGGFLENHCPNTFLNFNKDGTFSMSTSERDPGMKVLDDFLNSYLRTLSSEDKAKTLSFIGELVEGGFNGANPNELLGILLEGGNTDYAANLLAYLIKYEQTNPELAATVKDVLGKMGLEDVTGIVDTVTDIMNSKYFDEILGIAGVVGNHIPDWALEKLSKYLYEKYGIRLSTDELRKLLAIIGTVSDKLKTTEVSEDGSDKKVESTGKAAFAIRLKTMQEAEQEMASYHQLLKQIADEVGTLSANLAKGLYLVKIPLNRIKGIMEEEAGSLAKMSSVLAEAKKQYDTAEQRIAAAILGE